MVGPASNAAAPFPVKVKALIPAINVLVPTIHHVPRAPPRTKSLTLRLNRAKMPPMTSNNTKYAASVRYSVSMG